MDNDGMDEAIAGVMQVAMTAAARIGEQLARARETELRAAQARGEDAARAVAERHAAERAAARAALSSVHRGDWWTSASRDQIVGAFQTARAWSQVDPEAVRAEQRIVDEVRDRFGVGVERTMDPRDVATAIEAAERAGAAAAQERAAAGDDRAEAIGLLAAADAVDRAAEAQAVKGESPAAEQERADELRDGAEMAYDSAERRQAFAESLDQVENRVAVDARVRSDVAQGRPAAEAVTQAPRRAPKARRSRSQGQAAQRVQQRGR